MLKGAIISLHDVLVQQGATKRSLFDETMRLIRYLRLRGVEPVFVSNHRWTFTWKGVARPFREVLEEELGPVSYFVGGEDGMPYKPRAAATAHILEQKGWNRREVVYIGNTTDDMKTAANGKLLFLNVTWHTTGSPYGFQFDAPSDIARFIDCLCLGLDDWFWTLDSASLHVHALAPFTTLSAKYAQAHAYSANARATAKSNAGDATFWGRLLTARVYFSGLVDDIDYITAYPGHSPDSDETVIADALDILGKSLRKQYLPDLIIRHTKAQKSQTARNSGGSVDVTNQMNTIVLNPAPRKGLTGTPYVNPPVRRGKTVLLVDDICTQGHSFEAGRAFIAATGAKVICLSWLKTISTDYQEVFPPFAPFDPYKPMQRKAGVKTKAHWYSDAITSYAAPTNLSDLYQRYFAWQWPAGV